MRTLVASVTSIESVTRYFESVYSEKSLVRVMNRLVPGERVQFRLSWKLAILHAYDLMPIVQHVVQRRRLEETNLKHAQLDWHVRLLTKWANMIE